MNIPQLAYGSSSIKRTMNVLNPVETLNGETKVIYSIPVHQNSAISAEIQFFTFDVKNFNVGAFGTLKGMLTRGLGGPTVIGTKLDPIHNFTAPVPSINFVLNTSTQAIDVTVTGKVGITLHWHVELTVLQNT